MPPLSLPLYNALIRTHHITSRKKVASLRKSASNLNVFALLRYGGCPGIMYCEGASEESVREWVGCVQRLRYKDFQLCRKASSIALDDRVTVGREGVLGLQDRQKNWGRLEEVESVKEFGAKMQELGVWEWWRKGMGYQSLG